MNKLDIINNKILYQVHIGYLGWMPPSYSGTQESETIYPYNIQAILISPNAAFPGLKYKVNQKGVGWSPFVSAGDICGSVGKSNYIEGIAITYTGAQESKIGYRVYDGKNWTEWKINGAELFIGQPFSGLEIKLFNKNDLQTVNTDVKTIEVQNPFNSPTSSDSLDNIGLKYRTDKSSAHHNYLHFYDSFFSAFRNESFILAEIGVYTGASIKMWEEYFPKAKILAFDINPKENIYNNTTIIIGDASNPFLLAQFLSRNRPFIMIEDGSHKYSQQITTFEEAFLYILPGGFYICEDIQTSFGGYRDKSFYNDQPLDAITYFNQIAALVANKGNKDHPDLALVSKRQCDIARQIEYIVFRGECVMIKRKGSYKFN